jgi:hypothetical protein
MMVGDMYRKKMSHGFAYHDIVLPAGGHRPVFRT